MDGTGRAKISVGFQPIPFWLLIMNLFVKMYFVYNTVCTWNKYHTLIH